MIELYITPAALAAALYSNLRTGGVPDALTAGVAVCGLAVQAIAGGWEGLLNGLTGLAVGLLLFAVPFFLGWMGGGDVKLMGALGALLGPELALYATLYSAVAGGVLALVSLLWSAAARRRWMASGPPSEWGEAYPYAVAIAAGTFVALLSPIGL